MPDGLRLPVDELLAAHERVLRADGRAALEYGGNQGHEGLREWLASDYRARETAPVAAQDIGLTSGGSGGLKGLCDALIHPGGVILTGQPTVAGSPRAPGAFGGAV